MGIYTWGKIAFGMPNLRGWFYRLCTGAASTVLKICLGWCGASSLMVSGFNFFGDLFAILSTSKDSRSLMGGSDVVHCVRGTVDWHNNGSVRSVWECGWDCFVNILLTLCTILWTIGGPSVVVCNGPTSWQCSQAYMFDPVRVYVIISFGDCSASRFCPKYWAVPHHSAGAQHSGNGNGDSFNPIASPSAVKEVFNVLVPQFPT